MRMEKVNENQVRFILSNNDLTERDIKITELAYGSEKSQRLFREMMEQAANELGFEADNAPLMIEVVPSSMDSIMIIVSKVSEGEDWESKFNGLGRTRKMKVKIQDKEPPAAPALNDISIYSFNSIDDAANASSRIFGYYRGVSSLFKNQNRFYLVLQNVYMHGEPGKDELEVVLGEYGEKHISNKITKYYLIEHGELLIFSNAVGILATHLS